MTSEIKVGTVLWCHDYRSNSHKWFAETITGQTKQSWIMEGTHHPSKLLKKTMMENMGAYGHRRWYTAGQKEEYLWINTHRRLIGAAVEGCGNIETLKQVAALIGYTP